MAARPLNAPFVDLSHDEITRLKKETPEIFQDQEVWDIESGIWKKIVMEMHSRAARFDFDKFDEESAEKIMRFLAYDSRVRKTGKAASAWKNQRGQLIEEFRTYYPEKAVRVAF